MTGHQPVLMNEVIEELVHNKDGLYIDGTYGRGGHSAQILMQLGEQGRLLALDKDPAAVEHAKASLASDPRFSIKYGGFEDVEEHVESWLQGQGLSGVLLDLGVSSPQLDDPQRGFSFLRNGPLDMRMNPKGGVNAKDWLRKVSEEELAEVLRRLGEEPRAKKISRAIIRARDKSPITTTSRLANIVIDISPGGAHRIHPATRTFQAIRMHINKELESLHKGLNACTNLLGKGGRLCVISFHSLEDRLVKRFMARQARGDPAYIGLPDIPVEARPILRLVGKLIRPTNKEVESNPRSRSAKLRVAERLEAAFS